MELINYSNIRQRGVIKQKILSVYNPNNYCNRYFIGVFHESFIYRTS